MTRQTSEVSECRIEERRKTKGNSRQGGEGRRKRKRGRERERERGWGWGVRRKTYLLSQIRSRLWPREHLKTCRSLSTELTGQVMDEIQKRRRADRRQRQTDGQSKETDRQTGRQIRTYIHVHTRITIANERMRGRSSATTKPTTKEVRITPYLCMRTAPVLLSLHMEAWALKKARLAASLVIKSLTVDHFCSLPIHLCIIWPPITHRHQRAKQTSEETEMHVHIRIHAHAHPYRLHTHVYTYSSTYTITHD